MCWDEMSRPAKCSRPIRYSSRAPMSVLQRSWTSSSALFVENSANDRHHPRPIGLFARELPPAGRRNLVETRLAVVVRDVPLRAHETALLDTHQRRIQSPHIQSKRASGNLLQPRGDRVAMRWTERRQGLQNHQIECALKNIGLVACSIRHTNEVSTHSI